MQQAIIVAIGGAVGALARWSLTLILNSDDLPVGTFSVNLIGSFLLGCLTFALTQELVSETTALALGVGLLGAFTTMSTFSVETMKMFQDGLSTNAIIYVMLTMIMCPVLALLGWHTGARFIG